MIKTQKMREGNKDLSEILAYQKRPAPKSLAEYESIEIMLLCLPIRVATISMEEIGAYFFKGKPNNQK